MKASSWVSVEIKQKEEIGSYFFFVRAKTAFIAIMTAAGATNATM